MKIKDGEFISESNKIFILCVIVITICAFAEFITR